MRGTDTTGRAAELVENGADVEVTNANRNVYIHLLSHLYLNQNAEYTAAFVSGLATAVDPKWLHLFNDPQELNKLVAGELQSLDVEDLRAHTEYAGGYTSSSTTVKLFWKVSSTCGRRAGRGRGLTEKEGPPRPGSRRAAALPEIRHELVPGTPPRFRPPEPPLHHLQGQLRDVHLRGVRGQGRRPAAHCVDVLSSAETAQLQGGQESASQAAAGDQQRHGIRAQLTLGEHSAPGDVRGVHASSASPLQR